MSKIYFVRHGQSQFNAGITTQFNSELTSKGLKQAKEVAKKLKEAVGFTGYVSPYLRCLQTAMIIQRETGIKFTVVYELGESPEEIHKGFSCTVYSQKHLFPEFTWDNRYSYVYRENKETYNNRIDVFLKKLTGNLVVVSHMTPITHMINKICFNGKDSPMKIGNCSVSLIENNKPIFIGENFSLPA